MSEFLNKLCNHHFPSAISGFVSEASCPESSGSQLQDECTPDYLRSSSVRLLTLPCLREGAVLWCTGRTRQEKILLVSPLMCSPPGRYPPIFANSGKPQNFPTAEGRNIPFHTIINRPSVDRSLRLYYPALSPLL